MSEKKRYRVVGYLTISVTGVVEATSVADAKEKARSLGTPMLGQCCSAAGAEHEELWTLNGFDDPPEDGVNEAYEEEES